MNRDNSISTIKFEAGKSLSNSVVSRTWWNIEVPPAHTASVIEVWAASAHPTNNATSRGLGNDGFILLKSLSSVSGLIRTLTPEEIAIVGPHEEIRFKLASSVVGETLFFLHGTN